MRDRQPTVPQRLQFFFKRSKQLFGFGIQCISLGIREFLLPGISLVAGGEEVHDVVYHGSLVIQVLRKQPLYFRRLRSQRVHDALQRSFMLPDIAPHSSKEDVCDEEAEEKADKPCKTVSTHHDCPYVETEAKAYP